MRLYFLRHGEADWPGWNRPDDERPLTPEGSERIRRSARFLADRGVRPGTILSSPLERARQTADLLAQALRLEVQVEPLLGAGFGHESLIQMLMRTGGEDLLLVGHEPGMSLAVWDLTGGRVRMQPGTLACVELEDPGDLRGSLAFLIPPAISTR